MTDRADAPWVMLRREEERWAAWAAETCLLHGASAETAYHIASLFAAAVRRAREDRDG